MAALGRRSRGADPVTSFLGALGSCLLMSLRVAAMVRKLDLGRSSVMRAPMKRGTSRKLK